jgi:hypothetical protein
MLTYKIIRKVFKGEDQVIAQGLTLQEAQEHCNDPETSYKTCTSAEGQGLTEKHIMWFHCYYQE